MSGNNLSTLPPVSLVGWEKKAKAVGYEPPEPFPGIKIIDFCYLNPQELKDHEDLLSLQPRTKGLNEEHVRALVTDIAARGLKNAGLATACQQDSTKLATLTHHRVEAMIRLKESLIPCFVVNVVPYRDKQGRWHQHREIIDDYTSGIGLNQSANPQLDLTERDHLAWLQRKSSYGQFGNAKDDDLEKRVENFLSAELPWLDSRRRGRIRKAFMAGNRPEKVRPYTASKAQKAAGLNRKTENTWNETTNTLTKVCQTHAIDLAMGSIIGVIKEKAKDYRSLGKEEEFKKLLQDLKVHLVMYVGREGQLAKDKIYDARKTALGEVTLYNDMDYCLPYKCFKVSFLHQILEPKQEEEFDLIEHEWDYLNKTF
jgi:hypothetical protein